MVRKKNQKINLHGLCPADKVILPLVDNHQVFKF